MMLARHGRTSEGESLVRQALAMQRRTWGASHTAVAGAMASLAKLLTVDGYSPRRSSSRATPSRSSPRR
jgi:hypothetical protein